MRCIGRCGGAGAAAAIALGVCVAGCNAVRPGRTPADTFRAAKRAILEESYEGLWRLVAERSRESEASRIREQQRAVESNLGDMTPADVDQFSRENGVSPAEYVNLAPAQAFAAQVRNATRMAQGLRDALLDSIVRDVTVDGDRATVRIEIPGEAVAELAMVREQGLWVVPSMSDFFAALRLSGRIRTPGATPQETYDALLACVSSRAFGDIWDLFASDFQARLADTFTRSIDEVKRLDDDQRSQFERTYDVEVAEYVKMGPKELLALNMKVRFRDPLQLEMVLSRKVAGVAIADDTAVLSLGGAGGKSQVKLRKQGEKWYLLEF